MGCSRIGWGPVDRKTSQCEALALHGDVCVSDIILSGE